MLTVGTKVRLKVILPGDEFFLIKNDIYEIKEVDEHCPLGLVYLLADPGLSEILPWDGKWGYVREEQVKVVHD